MRAMILAAGRGERMRPLSDVLPKPLLAVGGKPLILWHIERLAQAGFLDVVINHAWLGEKIEAALGDGSRYGVRLHYSRETRALETAGGINHALPLLGDAPFLVINGDVWCDWPPARAVAQARDMMQSGDLAWLLLTDNPAHHPQGDFYLDEAGRVHDAWPERPAWPRPPRLTTDQSARLAACGEVKRGNRNIETQAAPSCGADAPTARSGFFTFTGIGLYQPRLFAGLARDGAKDTNPPAPAALAPLLKAAMRTGRVAGTHYNGDWLDVGTPQRLAALDKRLRAQTVRRA